MTGKLLLLALGLSITTCVAESGFQQGRMAPTPTKSIMRDNSQWDEDSRGDRDDSRQNPITIIRPNIIYQSQPDSDDSDFNDTNTNESNTNESNTNDDDFYDTDSYDNDFNAYDGGGALLVAPYANDLRRHYYRRHDDHRNDGGIHPMDHPHSNAQGAGEHRGEMHGSHMRSEGGRRGR